MSADLIVVGIGRREPVVRTDTQLLHDTLQTGVDVPGQVAGRQVPRDELVGYGHDVAEVSCQTEVEHGELMTFQRVLQHTTPTLY